MKLPASWHPSVVPVLGVLALGLILIAVVPRLPLTDEGGHAALHISEAVIVLLFVAILLRFWPKAKKPLDRIAKIVLTTALLILVASWIVEATGAFGFEGTVRTNNLATVHDAGMTVFRIGVLATFVGILLTLPLVRKR